MNSGPPQDRISTVKQSPFKLEKKEMYGRNPHTRFSEEADEPEEANSSNNRREESKEATSARDEPKEKSPPPPPPAQAQIQSQQPRSGSSRKGSPGEDDKGMRKFENSKLFKKFIAEESRKSHISVGMGSDEGRSRPETKEDSGSARKSAQHDASAIYMTPDKSMNTYDVHREEGGSARKSHGEEESPKVPHTAANMISPIRNDAPANEQCMMASSMAAMSPPPQSLSLAQPGIYVNSNPVSMSTIGTGTFAMSQPAPISASVSNPMQDYEHGMIIAQYESLLQQLSGQLEKQIKRNRELEGVVGSQAAKSTKLIEALRAQAEEEMQELAKRAEAAEREREELRSKVEAIESDHKRFVLEREQESQMTDELRRRLDCDGANKVRMSQVEEELRKALSQVNGKNVSLEAELRKKDEEIFSLHNANEQVKAEIVTHKEIVKQLKNDYALLVQKKGEGDTETQGLMSRIYAAEIAMHKMSQENERLERAVAVLNGAKEASDQSMEEIKKDNMELKRALTEAEKEKTQVAARLEKAHRDYQTLEIALMKAENNVRLQTDTIAELQSDYSSLLDKERQQFTPGKPPTVPGRSEAAALSMSMTMPRGSPPKRSESETMSRLGDGNGNGNTAAAPATEHEETKSKYLEYKQRQNTSALGDMFRWGNEPEQVPAQSNRGPNPMDERPLSGTMIDPSQRSGGAKMATPDRKDSAAANKLVIVTMPSNRKYEESKDQIAKLQNNLQSLLAEKQKLDKDYSKFGARAEKSMAQRKKKEELEFDLDLNEKNIQRVKHKLRELNAFS